MSGWPYRHANKLPLQIETLIVRLKRERPSWAPKIREKLRRAIEDQAVIERILSWLDLWHPLPACGPSPPAEHTSLPLTYHPVPDIA